MDKPIVKLLTYTPEPEKIIASAARLCYANTVSIDTLMDNLSEDKIETMVEKLASMGHSSPFCQVSYTFGIENVSRAFTHQFARHHVGVSFDQRSQRYVNEGKFNYITPPAIEANDEIHEKFQAFMEYTSRFYNEMVSAGIKKEDARSILPNACETKLIATINAQELFHIFGLRCCCYDDKTEVLTNNGWKFFKDISDEDLFYSMNPKTHKTELVEKKQYIKEFYNGDMVTVNSQSINLNVTPTHNMYVAYSYDYKNYNFDKAKNINTHKKVFMKKNCLPIKGEIIEYFCIPSIENIVNKNRLHHDSATGKKVPINDFLQFLGMYLSDGYVTKANYHYIVGISKGDINKINKYKSILEKLSNNKPSIIKDGNGWKLQIHDRRLYEYFKQFGKAKDKYIPNEIFNLDSSLLKYLFHGLCDGDMNKAKTEYSTISYQLANDITRLCLHIGLSATIMVNNRIDKKHIVKNKYNNKFHTIENKNVSYVVSINRTKNEPAIKYSNRNNISTTHYEGYVYCVDLKRNHLLYVRKNGRSVWCGNCRAQFEFRQVANEMLRLVKEISPKIFKNAGAHCDMYGYCPEGDMCCGKAPTLQEVLKGYKERISE